MNHEMNLHAAPFELIGDGSKTVEMRLNDERRKNIKSGDTIVFTNMDTNEKLEAAVLKVISFKDFADLYEHYNKTDIGYKEDEAANPDDMFMYYTKEQVKKYGVLAISIKVTTKQ